MDTRPCAADLAELSEALARMGGLTESQTAQAVEALSRRDVALAEALIARDVRLDAMQAAIERRALRLIAAHAPGEDDLRQVLSAVKLAMNLERCGDLARNIAKRSLVLSAADPVVPVIRSLERLGLLAAARLRDALDAHAARNVERAMAVWRQDDQIDEHYESLFLEIVGHMTVQGAAVTVGAHLMFIAKNLERIGDHATNIAEITYYEITGGELAAERPRGIEDWGQTG